jgi:hypothetical protein
LGRFWTLRAFKRRSREPRIVWQRQEQRRRKPQQRQRLTRFSIRCSAQRFRKTQRHRRHSLESENAKPRWKENKPMPKELHADLLRRARKLGLAKKRRDAYIFGTLQEVEAAKKAKRLRESRRSKP